MKTKSGATGKNLRSNQVSADWDHPMEAGLVHEALDLIKENPVFPPGKPVAPPAISSRRGWSRAELGPFQASTIAPSAPSSPRLGCLMSLSGEIGTVIGNNGFGGIVIRMSNGRIAFVHACQWQNEIGNKTPDTDRRIDSPYMVESTSDRQE